MIELITKHNDIVYIPSVEEGVEWSTERQGSPGELSFSVIKDDTLKLEEGDPVRMRKDDKDVFYGFVFKRKQDKENVIDITAYDQLRYLKNKDTYVYSGKTADELIGMLANDFNLRTGALDDTGYKIASRVEDNTSLFDIIYNALDLTLGNTGEMYVLFDDFGKLSLKNIADMRLDLLIDEETGENYSYDSDIDSDTSNKIKLIRENDETGDREVYIAQHSDHINDWGVLQKFDKLSEGENGKSKADALLSLRDQKTRELSIDNAFGDIRVRAGSMVVVKLDLGDVKLQNYMLVEKCKHKFKNKSHRMDLTLRGGGFSA